MVRLLKITTGMIENWRDRVQIGDELRCKRFKDLYSRSDVEVNDTCIVLRKFPHFAMTTLGDFAWTDLYFANRRRYYSVEISLLQD